MKTLPLVSCIMPTANREKFLPYAIDYFIHQDYQNTELIILDDGTHPSISAVANHHKIRYSYSKLQQSIGAKRNRCCEEARGEIIMHWDDDDWYAEDWISRQVKALINSGADITGISNVNFFSTALNKIWKYKNSAPDQPWVYGGTLAYQKYFWKEHPFKEMNSGEDNDFINHKNARVYDHQYTDGYLGIIHNDNIGITLFEDPREKIQLIKWLQNIDKPQKKEEHTSIGINENLPLVSCIMPTANRRNFIHTAIKNFLQQDYLNAELIIIDDGNESINDLIPENSKIQYFYFQQPLGTIGLKRNIACEKSKGEFIIHLDDDDWYAKDWISYEVNAIRNSDADICGINQVQFYSPSLDTYWMTKNSNSKRPWLTGASLIYRKSFWERHPFKDLQIGEDDDYVRNSGAKIFAHDYYQGFIATLHPHNTSIKFFEDAKDKIRS